MTIKYLSGASVYVSDMDRSLDFYISKLGFEKTNDQIYGEGMRWLDIKLPDSQVTIELVDAKIGEAYNMGYVLGKFTGYAFYSDDVRATCAELEAKGVVITAQPSDQPWGVMAQFADPDGNSFIIASNR